MKESKGEVPEGKLRRSGIVASTTARAGLKKIRYLSKKPFLSSMDQEREGRRNDEEIARNIFEGLSLLRGTALKAAQMMAMEMELIPEAYRKEMEKTASRVPPMNRALIRKVITRELGGPPEKIFRSFESLPFAAASLGQVHRAVTRQGEELAVKVQYPGVASSVASDLEMLKTLLRPSRYYRIFKSCFKEIQERISEELDYTIEARNTAWFAEHLNIDRIVVPRVYPEYTTSHVLATRMIPGRHLDDWLAANPAQKTKDRYGQLLVDLFHYTLYQKNVIHADPNMGNYIFMDDGRLGLIDFGCVKWLERPFVEVFKTSLHNDFEKHPEKLKAFYQGTGIHFHHDFSHQEFEAFILRWVEWILRPEREEWFEFYEGSEYFREGQSLIKEFYRHIDFFDGKFIYFGRSFYGLRRLLQRIGVRVKMGSLG